MNFYQLVPSSQLLNLLENKRVWKYYLYKLSGHSGVLIVLALIQNIFNIKLVISKLILVQRIKKQIICVL